MTNRPNVLLVLFDSLSARQLEQNARDLPALTALLDTAINFTNAYACGPESSPARSSLFTGLDMATHGVWTDGVTLPARETLMPEVFAQNGYHSWLIGRRQLGGVSNWTTEHARAHEYHDFRWAHGPLHRSRQNAYLAWLQRTEPETYAAIFPRQANADDTEISPSQIQAMATLPDHLSFNAWVTDCMREHIGEDPFFGVAGFVVGQNMGMSGTVSENLNPNALRQADAALAVILKELPENTVLVVTAGRGSVNDTVTPDPLQEDAIKVPLVLRMPDSKAQTVEDVVSTMDIAPTLFEFANIRPPQRIQGKSLISSPPRGWALSRLRHPDMSQQTALMTNRWKLVMTHGTKPSLNLFDLAADPGEARDLAAEPHYQETLEAMIDQMIDARVALEDRTEPRIAKF